MSIKTLDTSTRRIVETHIEAKIKEHQRSLEGTTETVEIFRLQGRVRALRDMLLEMKPVDLPGLSMEPLGSQDARAAGY